MAALTQKTAFTDDFTVLADKPNKTAAEMKAMFQSQPTELLTYINNTQIKEITEGTYNFAASAVGTDAYAVTITNVAALTAGLELFVLADVANTGACTCQVNALTAKAIRKNGTTVLEDGDIPAGGVAHLKYDGTNFQLLNPVKTTAVTAHQAKEATQSELGHIKLQEAWITATLLNGWTGTLKYAKNDLGMVTLAGALTVGTDTAYTSIAADLPIGYRSTNGPKVVPVLNNTTGSVSSGLRIATSGGVVVTGDSDFATGNSIGFQASYYID